jgi:hypothetical protein
VNKPSVALTNSIGSLRNRTRSFQVMEADCDDLKPKPCLRHCCAPSNDVAAWSVGTIHCHRSKGGIVAILDNEVWKALNQINAEMVGKAEGCRRILTCVL